MEKKHRLKKKHKHQPERHSHRYGGKKLLYILSISIAVIVIVGVVVFIAARTAEDRLPGTFMPNLGNLHIDDPNATSIQYNSVPPTSGPHYGGGLARWGIHTEPIPKGLMVHNLEDGGVVISYSPQTPREIVDKLAQIVSRYPKYVILAPYPGLNSAIALTAWQRIDKMDAVDEARIVRFIESYQSIDHHVK